MTEKMKFETKDLTQENIAKIGQLFPEVLTEAKDDNGTLKKAIDFDKLRQILSDSAIDNRETYDFTWVGKKRAILEAATPIRKTLRPCKEESVNWDTTQNLYIEGDNLDVLKLLQESYLGKVKMIYIDPPYNTGNDFIYRDDFAMSQEEYEESGERIDESGNRLVKNTDSNGRFHSDWCSMMYPRLKLARNLLTDDGVIFISIDDNEVENLRKICDEVFGEKCFLGQFVWQKKTQPSFLSKEIANITEYILTYKKTQGIIPLKGGLSDNNRDSELINIGNPVVERILPFESVEVERGNFSGTISAGTYGNGVLQIEVLEDVNVTKGIPDRDIKIKGRITRSQNTLADDISRGARIFIRSTKTMRPTIHLNREQATIKPPVSLLSKKLDKDIPTNTDASSEIKDMFGGINIMAYPKPMQLMHFLSESVTYENPHAIVLDFFSGSATTAHAVMKLNAENGGSRKFIMVQLPEECDKTSEAYKAGYKNICEIGKERIRRAAKQIKEEHPESNFDGGFRVFKLADSNMKDVYYNPAEYTQDLLDKMTSNIKEDRNDMDLLYGCMLEWGLPLSYPHTSEKVGSYTIHTVNNGALVACFDENITEDIIRHIAAKKPLRVVFRDAGFTDSPAKINVGELFKLLSPDTTVKVI